MASVNNFFNAARDMVTIYTPEGEPHKCSRLNAKELVSSQGFRWRNDTAKVNAVKDEPEKDTPTETETVVETTVVPPKADHVNDSLVDIAEAINGSSDVQPYLEGFTSDALRTMAEERYNERLHHKLGKSKIIEKIIELEDEKLSQEEG